MQHFESLEQVSVENAWLTIGSFDGVHRGHQEIIRNLVTGARAASVPAIVLTFYPHPVFVLRGHNGPFYLTSPQERATLLGELGVDVVITCPFNQQVAATSARDFMGKLQRHLGLRQLWVGQDFTLGRNREGTLPVLRQLGVEFGYEVQVLPPVEIDGFGISSSQIRIFLGKGEVDSAARMLGRPYRLVGQVVHGDGRGRTIGIPTANLAIWLERLVPKAGVYACQAHLAQRNYAAAVNIGVRPTFDGNALAPQVEAHLLDFEGDLYGQEIQLDFITRLRDEQRFPNIETLVSQIQHDIARTRSLLL
jgi:riboflavin kinase/FMN adenylyltransferase